MRQKIVIVTVSAILFIGNLFAQGIIAPATPNLIVIHGEVIEFDTSPMAIDAPGILKVKTDQDRLWHISFGGFRSCSILSSFPDELPVGSMVRVRGNYVSNTGNTEYGQLDVCQNGTYIQMMDPGEIEAEKLVSFEGTIQYFDPSPTYVDGIGILLVADSEGDLWDIGFGGMRSPSCDVWVQEQGMVAGETKVKVSGRMLENGTLDICQEGTYVQIIDLSTVSLNRKNRKITDSCSDLVFSVNGRRLGYVNKAGTPFYYVR